MFNLKEKEMDKYTFLNKLDDITSLWFRDLKTDDEALKETFEHMKNFKYEWLEKEVKNESK